MPNASLAERVAETAETFQMLDPQTRLELLLDYADGLPELPEALRAERDAGLGRIVECQSPVYLFTAVEDGRVRLWADAPVQAPTVRGFAGLLTELVDGAPTSDIADLPDDLLYRLGIGQSLGMTRQRGLAAVLHRVKHAVADTA